MGKKEKGKYMKKIVYINGFNGENSSKAKLLKEKYKAEHIVLKNDFNPKEVCQKLKEIKPQIVVASSTGCFVADSCEYDKAYFIYLNPLVDLNDLAKLTDISKLKNLKPKDKQRLVFVNEDDELLDYKKAYQKYDKVFSFKKGGHRFDNIEDLFEIIEYPEYYAINEEFREFFTKNELKKLLDFTAIMDYSTLIVNTQNYMFEIASGYEEGIRIFDQTDELKVIDKKTLFEMLENEKFKKIKCISIKE